MPVEIEFTSDMTRKLEISIEEILREKDPSAADIIDTFLS